MTKIVVFISGRGSNMEALIHATQKGILKGVAEIVLVFSDNPEAKGLSIAKSLGINTLSIDSNGKKRVNFDLEVVNFLHHYDFDYIVLAGYMRILSSEFVRKFKDRIINIHPADTNLHQGLHAYQWALENKLQKTKITVHFVNEGVDTGKIIDQIEVDLKDAKTLNEIESKGLEVEHQFYAKTLYSLFSKNY